MTNSKQFWALFKFQATVNPFLLLMPLIFAMPMLFTSMTPIKDYHPSLETLLLGNSNLFFVGFIGVGLLMPELFQYGAAAAAWSSGTEFVLTRAIDRPLLYRARSFFFYALVLGIPLVLLALSAQKPNLQLDEYNKTAHREILAQIPTAIAAPADKNGSSHGITIPNGNLLVAGWLVSVFLLTALITQLLIFLIYPLKYRRIIFWVVYMSLVFTPLLSVIYARHDQLSASELMFLWFAGHQVLVWPVLLIATVVAQWWFERSFTRMEQ